MSDTHEQQLTRRRRALAQRYEQQKEPSSALCAEQERDIALLMEKARQHDIGTHHPPDLTALLSTIAPDQQIPPPLCKAVASLVTWLQQLEEQSADK